ncbi:hypothetical protein [Vreelandella venusta]|uniref:hypothetical protein n=1 Tax=Vreelandella venusta TaxID=44935 RepID=UPI0013DDA72D|nr:hypothetical protein [Halomonas venusta]
MLACVLRQRDSMGYLMDRWNDYPTESREVCLAQSRSVNTVDYVELEACLVDV